MKHLLLRRSVAVLAFLAVASLAPSWLLACPFCEQSGKTLTKEVADAKLVVFGTLTKSTLKIGPDGADLSTTEMDVEDVVKEHPFIKGSKSVVLPRYIPITGEPIRFLIFADIYKEKLDPYRGIASNSRAMVDYLKGALKLPEQQVVQRLQFFLDYLDHEDTEIALDAYREFAVADYKDVVAAVKASDTDRLRVRLLGWLQDPETPPYRYGFYGMLLGLVGKPVDGDVFRSLLDDPDRGLVTGVDGIMAGYTRVDRADGWAYLARQLQSADLPYARRYAALRTVRFLLRYQPEVVERKLLLSGMATLLEQADLADLAIDDFRKMKEWQYTEQILAAFGKETHQVPQVRRAILRYALQCPDASAQKFLTVQRQRDPKLVEQVEEFLKLELPDD